MTAAKRPAAPGTDAMAVRRGRSSPTYTDVHDWVMYSGATPTAIALYAILRSHVNRQRGDDAVWTSTLTLSVLLKLSRGDKVKPYLDELAALGAITVSRGGLHRKNEYVVHALPPGGYAGPASGPEWYARNKPMLERRREQDKAVRDARRDQARGAGNGRSTRKDSDVTPPGGEQNSGDVTPWRGAEVTPVEGLPLPPSTGREPKEVELEEEEPSPPTPAAPVAAPVAAEIKSGEGISPTTNTPTPDGLGELVASLVEVAPWWDAGDTRAVLEELRNRRIAPVEIARVAAEFAGGVYGTTHVPSRMLKHWPTSRPAAAAVEPEWARPSISYLAPGTEMCRVHRGEPAQGCGKCRTERFVTEDDVRLAGAPRLSVADAVALARATAKTAGGGAKVRQQRSERISAATGPAPVSVGYLLGQAAATVSRAVA